MHGLDTDSDGYQTKLSVEITIPSEDADWLEYRVHSIKSDPNINSVFSILSGSVGSQAGNNRYHLEDGSDDLVTGLNPNTWNNFDSDYSMIYEHSGVSDAGNKAVLAWVRFKEGENVKFQDVGLWNDPNGRASSRIRYDIKDATKKDWFSYLLVFSRGDKRTIDRWLPVLKSGKLPETGFMTIPARVVQDTHPPKHGP